MYLSLFQLPKQLSYYDLSVAFTNETSDIVVESGVIFPQNPQQQIDTPGPTPQCVMSEKDLMKEVTNCDKTMNETSCLIDICSIHLVINRSEHKGIDLSHRNMIIGCEQTCPGKRCIIDGLGKTRLFYGSYMNVTFFNIIFINGYHYEEGGSMKMDNNSIASFINCSFVNNSAHLGSAIFVKQSNMTVIGSETSFINNTGTGPPLFVLSSHLNISNAIFAGSIVLEYHSDILLFNSTFQPYDLHFLSALDVSSNSSNSVTNEANCNVYIAGSVDDIKNQSSCMVFDPSTKTFPVTDLSLECPTAPPTLAPMRASNPSPTICFSSQNKVTVKDLGPIPINLLRIGDMVKSNDDIYTQVYGFGHLDHQHEGTFLHITFKMCDRQTCQYPALFLEISARHLVMITKNENSYHIPAMDVVVGDILSGQQVETIHSVIRRGIYAPLTQSGEIMVSGILVSSYVDLIDHHNIARTWKGWNRHIAAHILFHPQRYFCYHYLDICKKEIYINGYGILAYAIIALSSIKQTFQTIVFSFVAKVTLFWSLNPIIRFSFLLVSIVIIMIIGRCSL
jgi:Hint module